MTASTALKAGVAATVTGIVVALAYGMLSKPTPVEGYIEFPWDDGGVPPGVECLEFAGEVSDAGMAVLGYVGEPEQVVLARVCAAPLDGGTVSTPGGFQGIGETGETFPYEEGQPRMQVWTQAAAPWEWACSSGVNCYERLPDGGAVEARIDMTHEWGALISVDGGCIRKPRIERTLPIWPAGCPKG